MQEDDRAMDDPRETVLALLQQGDFEQAKDQLTVLCEKEHEDANLWFMLGTACGQLQQGEAALDAFRRAVEIDPDYASAYVNMGNAYTVAGNLEEAVLAYQTALSKDPQLSDAHRNMGIALQSLNRLDEAVIAFEAALEFFPDDSVIQLNLGSLYQQQGDLGEAEAYYRQSIAGDVFNPRAYLSLGTVLHSQGRYQQAIEAYQEAIRLKPDYDKAHMYLGALFYSIGLLDNALACYQQALLSGGEPADLHVQVGRILMQQGELAAALENSQKALNIRLDHLEAVALKAGILEKQGKTREAYELLEPLIDTGVRDINVVLAFADIASTPDDVDRGIGLLEEQGNNTALPAAVRMQVLNMLGRLYDRKGGYDEAFRHIQQCNRLKGGNYQSGANVQLVNELTRVFSSGFLHTAPRSGYVSDFPLFIVGMPRSGMALVEQVLSSHPQIQGAGELPDIGIAVAEIVRQSGGGQGYPGCVPSVTADVLDGLSSPYISRLMMMAESGVERIIDRAPQNFLHLGLIELLFPEGRVINVLRDPRDTCLSCYFHYHEFPPQATFASGLDHLASYYREYQRLMEHWKQVLTIPVMDVRYEDLVEDPAGVCHKLVDFSGLSWDERCLGFLENASGDTTIATSAVRAPISRSSIGRWRHYESHLGPLLHLPES